MPKKVTKTRRVRKIVTPKTDWFADNKKLPDYKEVVVLQRFVSDRGKILPRSRTGLSAKNQRLLTRAVKYARHLALLPFIVSE